MRHKIAFLFLAALCIAEVASWSGKFCTSRATRLERRRRCRYRLWGACCAWEWYWKCIYFNVFFCCSGWKETSPGNQDCTKAICNPPCRNGGRCKFPGKCECPDSFTGLVCGEMACSSVFPCYPGVCDGATAASCRCHSGYIMGSNWCNTLASSSKPEITNVITHMKRFDRQKDMELFRLVADATNDQYTQLSTFWANQKDFNKITVYFESLYTDRETVPTFPYYITDYRIGIIASKASVIHTKIHFGGGGRKTVAELNKDILVDKWEAPEESVSVYNYTFENFHTLIEHRDIITITVTATNGGYRTVKSPNSQQRKQRIAGHSSVKRTYYKFDFKKPTHCNDACTGNKVPLFITEPDITKVGFAIQWEGWTDAVSGMYRYVWEVFRLAVDRDGFLTEPDVPLNLTEITVSVNDAVRYSRPYTPTNAGMYSIILEASDRANNSEYVRRLVLYDPDPSVTINDRPGSELFVSSAARETGFTWQGNTNEKITVNWTNHFSNTKHHKGGFLNAARPYPKRLKRKQIEPKYEDNSGARTLKEIPNANGIVKFEISYSVSSSLGSLPETPGRWDIVPGVNQTFALGVQPVDGESLRVWIRATDVLGASNIDNTTISFDTTAPIIQNQALRNVPDKNIEFSSMIDVVTEDKESGTWKIQLDFLSNDTGQVLSTHMVETRTAATESECKSDVLNCYTSRDGHHYYRPLSIPFNHCWIRVPKRNLSDSLRIDMRAINMALLKTQTPVSLFVGRIRNLTGLERFHAPKDFETVDTSLSSVTLKWKNSQNCYKRTGIHYRYSYKRDGKTVERDELIREDKNEISLNGLESGTNYTIWMSTMYDQDASDPVIYHFKTDSRVLSGGEIAGIVIGILLLCIIAVLVILLVVFWRRERVQIVVRRLTTRFTERKSGVRHHNAFQNQAFKGNDVNLYGNMPVDSHQTWVVPSSNVQILNHVTDGRFAAIYTAMLDQKTGRLSVAAKMLKADHTPEDVTVMKAKMNFLATNLGQGQGHENVLGFIGGVLDDKRGPMILTEYCEQGTLKDWLTYQQSNPIDERVMECLYQFSVGIAKGMDFLASKKIVHRKLAARNILLTAQLVPKISGFGPAPNSDDDNDNSRAKKEKIPLKWVAPECMKSMKNANEKSDVWSFGVVDWEIFSLGEMPYHNIDNNELAKRIKSGYRLPKPELCPDPYYAMMQKCWNDRANHRPTFKKIVIEHLNMFDDQGNNYYA